MARTAVRPPAPSSRRGTTASRRGPLPLPGQRSLDDLGAPLHEVTFCVVDLETTGGSPQSCGITEVGAVKLRGGEQLATFQTLVNPGSAIPPEITVLTGITQAMVLPAPRIESVLPALLEFAGDAVLVGHNVRFDVSFLDAALLRADRPRLANRVIDTLALARRLVRDEVPNLRLGTLADRLRLTHRPSHRALDDALATGDLLHLLLERAAGLGVSGLDDLLSLPTMAGHAQASKLGLTAALPREPGVYLFRDRAGRVLYVGKATNLRSRVRSYFSTDARRKIPSLLREAHSIDHEVCTHPLEAAVREVRLIHEHLPRYNRQGRSWQRYVYLKLTYEVFPRLSVVRTVRADDGFYLGPLPSTRFARLVADAIESAAPLRRCTARPGSSPRQAPCAPAQLGVATCPCAGSIDAAGYAAIVSRVRRGLSSEPALLLEPLADKMRSLAAAERYEEAADVRDRAEALSRALRRQRRLDSLVSAGRLRLLLPGGGGAELRNGRLVRAWGLEPPDRVTLPFPDDAGLDEAPDEGIGSPLPREAADELLCVAGWLDRHAGRIELVHAENGLCSPATAMPSFATHDRGPSR